jgi:hypothetical protein
LGCGHDRALYLAATSLAARRAVQALGGLGEQRLSGLVCDGAGRSWRWGVAAAQECVACAFGDCVDVGGRDVQQRYLGLRGKECCRLGDGGFPCVFDDPDERAHVRWLSG